MNADEAKELLGSTEIIDKVLTATTTSMNAYADVMGDYKKSTSRIYKMFIGALIIIVLMGAGFVYGFIRQQEKYLQVIEAQRTEYLKVIELQQKDFVDFLSNYDFEVYDQSGDGTNYLNRDVQGGAYNGTTPETEDKKE